MTTWLEDELNVRRRDDEGSGGECIVTQNDRGQVACYAPFRGEREPAEGPIWCYPRTATVSWRAAKPRICAALHRSQPCKETSIYLPSIDAELTGESLVLYQEDKA